LFQKRLAPLDVAFLSGLPATTPPCRHHECNE
jgi:hypothetical protein